MKALALLLAAALLSSCDTLRRNIESVDVEGSYGGASTRARFVLREPDYSK